MPTHTERERQRKKRQQQNTMAPRQKSTSASLAPQLGQMNNRQGGGNNTSAPQIGDVVGRIAPQRQEANVPTPSSVLRDRAIAGVRQAQRTGQWQPGDPLPPELMRERRATRERRLMEESAPQIEELQMQRQRAAQTGLTQSEANRNLMEGTASLATPLSELLAARRAAQAQENVAETEAEANMNVARTEATAPQVVPGGGGVFQPGQGLTMAPRLFERLDRGQRLVNPETGEVVAQGAPPETEPGEPFEFVQPRTIGDDQVFPGGIFDPNTGQFRPAGEGGAPQQSAQQTQIPDFAAMSEDEIMQMLPEGVTLDQIRTAAQEEGLTLEEALQNMWANQG